MFVSGLDRRNPEQTDNPGVRILSCDQELKSLLACLGEGNFPKVHDLIIVFRRIIILRGTLIYIVDRELDNSVPIPFRIPTRTS